MPVRSLSRAAAVMITCVTLLAAGCTSADEMTTVNDPSGLFHVRTPASWQSLARPGLIAFYAAEEPPATDEATFDTLSVGVFTASKAATDPLGPRLEGLIDSRAKNRGWDEYSLDAVEEMEIGGRPGVGARVSGTDEKQRSFSGQAALVRTSGKEVLIFAVSPAADWDTHAPSVSALFTEWYWHVRADEATTTAP